MTRPIGHPAIRPFRLNRATFEAHRDHLPTPFLGCPICIRRGTPRSGEVRWMSPRHR